MYENNNTFSYFFIYLLTCWITFSSTNRYLIGKYIPDPAKNALDPTGLKLIHMTYNTTGTYYNKISLAVADLE